MNRKSLRLMIIIVSCIFVLCGCGKSKQAKEVDELIAAIGEVSLNSEKDIVSAEEYYDTLTEKQRNEVEDYKTLVDARKKYDQLVEEKRKQEEIERTKKEVSEFEARLVEVSLMKSKPQKVIDEITEVYNSYTDEKKSYFKNKSSFENAISLTDYEKAAISASQQLRGILKNSSSMKLLSINVAKGGPKTLSEYYVYIKYSATNGFGAYKDGTQTIDVTKNFAGNMWSINRAFAALGSNTTSQGELMIYKLYLTECTDDTEMDCERIMNNIDVDVKNVSGNSIT